MGQAEFLAFNALTKCILEAWHRSDLNQISEIYEIYDRNMFILSLGFLTRIS